VRYYWYVYIYIYIVQFTLYATDWRFRIFSLNFSIKMTPSMTVHVIHLHQQYTNPEKPQVWALTSRCIQRDPFMVPKSSQGAPLSSYQPTKQTQPAIELGGWHWKCPSVIWGDDILLRNIWACCISCEGSQSIGNWWNKTTKTTWNHGFPGFPKKRVPSIYGMICSKLGNLLQNFKYAGINTVFFHVFPCLFNHRFIHAVGWSFP